MTAPRLLTASIAATAAAALALCLAPGARAQSLEARAGPCQMEYPAGQSSVPLLSAGEERPFQFFVPSSYNGRKRLPLVLNLHGSGSNGSQQMDFSEMAAAAENAGVAVAAPNGAVPVGGIGYAWNVPGVPLVGGQPVPAGTANDERYLLDVVRAAKRTVCIDPERIYVTGISGGARMASQMACDYSHKIAAIAPVAGLRAGAPSETSPHIWVPDRATCKPQEPVPVRTFHGTADTVNPFLGSEDPRWGYSVAAAVTRWARIDGCRKGPKPATVSATVTRVAFAKCRSDVAVQLYREEGAGHTWPGSSFQPQIGEVDQSIDASRLALRFFEKYTVTDRGE